MMPAATPDNPMASSQKYMTYIMPFFALTGLYWPFGLVLYWVTTNVWTLGQQFILGRRYPYTAAGDGRTAPAPAPAAARALTGGGAKAGRPRPALRPRPQARHEQGRAVAAGRRSQQARQDGGRSRQWGERQWCGAC